MRDWRKFFTFHVFTYKKKLHNRYLDVQNSKWRIQNNGSKMADQNYKKWSDFHKIWYPYAFWVSESEYDIKIQKWRMQYDALKL